MNRVKQYLNNNDYTLWWEVAHVIVSLCLKFKYCFKSSRTWNP